MTASEYGARRPRRPAAAGVPARMGRGGYAAAAPGATRRPASPLLLQGGLAQVEVDPGEAHDLALERRPLRRGRERVVERHHGDVGEDALLDRPVELLALRVVGRAAGGLEGVVDLGHGVARDVVRGDLRRVE